MTVSVIMPTYRRNERLDLALKSLCNQTYKDFEVIVIDDNVDEKWNNIVKNIIDKYSFVKLIINKNHCNSAMSRQKGILMSKGDYITFLDDDDFYFPEKIEKQLKCIYENNADYCISDCFLYNEKGKIVDKRVRSYLNKKNLDKTDLLKIHFCYHLSGTNTLMFKKKYLLEIGGFENISPLGDEFHLIYKAIQGNGKICYQPGCYVQNIYNSTESSLSTGDSKIKMENDLHIFKQKHFNNLDKKTIRFINMRHNAVLAFSYLRDKKIIKTIKYGFLSFIISPINCIKLILNRKF